MFQHNKNLVSTVVAIILACLSTTIKADQIDSLVHEKMKTRHIPGLQLAVVKEGKVVKLKSYGNLDVEAQQSVNNDTLFPINSMTKAFTGTLIVKLASTGKLKLSDPVSKHLDNLPMNWQKLTIGQVLSHTSGLPSIMTGNLIQMVGDGTDDGAWKAVQKLPMQGKPDSQFNYNQTGYALLGKIIEKHTEKSYEQAIKALLHDANMTDTAKHAFEASTETTIAKQYLYSDNNFQHLPLNFPRILWPAAGMNSSAKDLAKFVTALQNETWFDSAYLKTLWTPHRLKDGKTAGFNNYENGYAAGWQVIEKHSAVSASGGNAVSLIVYPEDEVSVIVLTNLLGSLPIEFVDDIAAFYR